MTCRRKPHTIRKQKGNTRDRTDHTQPVSGQQQILYCQNQVQTKESRIPLSSKTVYKVLKKQVLNRLLSCKIKKVL